MSDSTTTGGISRDRSEFVESLNRGYVCPPDAGPAWRAACEFGLDVSLVEEALHMTEEQRLAEHQRALDRLLRLTANEHDPAA